MALEIAIQTDFGAPAIYWRIGCINDAFHGQVQVILEGYASEEARRKSKQPLARESIIIEGIETSRQEIYTFLKQTEQFKNAIDV